MIGGGEATACSLIDSLRLAQTIGLRSTFTCVETVVPFSIESGRINVSITD